MRRGRGRWGNLYVGIGGRWIYSPVVSATAVPCAVLTLARLGDGPATTDLAALLNDTVPVGELTKRGRKGPRGAVGLVCCPAGSSINGLCFGSINKNQIPGKQNRKQRQRRREGQARAACRKGAGGVRGVAKGRRREAQPWL